MKKVVTCHSHIRMLMHPVTLKQAIDRAALQVRRVMKKHRVDAIAVRGISGAAVGFAVAAKVGLPVILVRKRGDDSHSRAVHERLVESTGNIEVADNTLRYVIVDDFIENGGTIEAIHQSIKDAFMNQVTINLESGEDVDCSTYVECVAVVLYSDWVQWNDERKNGELYQTELGSSWKIWAAPPVEEVYP